MMEVGALLVGKIVNHHGAAAVTRGQEKGYFQFGGSTVVLLLKPNTVTVDADILENSAQGIETVVRFGEKIGFASLR
jgi:phosphatidylserine decarboxylase